MLRLVCNKAFYQFYPFYQTLSDRFRTHTCEYITEHKDVLNMIKEDLGKNMRFALSGTLLDDEVLIFEQVHNFISNVTLGEFIGLYLMNSIEHPNYLREKYDQMKDTPTYFIVTRDDKHYQIFVKMVKSYNSTTIIPENDAEQYFIMQEHFGLTFYSVISNPNKMIIGIKHDDDHYKLEHNDIAIIDNFHYAISILGLTVNKNQNMYIGYDKKSRTQALMEFKFCSDHDSYSVELQRDGNIIFSVNLH